MSPNPYVGENRGYVTASKLKAFRKNPEEYKIMYIDEIVLESDARHFVIGNAFDDLVTYRIKHGNNTVYAFEGEPLAELVRDIQKLKDEKVDKDKKRIQMRCQKYYIEEGLVTDELKRELTKLPEDQRYGLSDYAIKNMKLPELRAIYYRDPNNKRIRLTPGEGKQIMGMYKEVLRQPKMEMFARFGTQHLVIGEYDGMKLRGRLDRLVFVDKNGEHYLPEEVDTYIQEAGFQKWKELVAQNQITAKIRDWKTCGNFSTFEYDMEENWDYILSMSFYYVLVLCKYGVTSDVYLDVLGKQEPYGSVVYRLKKEKIRRKIQEEVKPLLQALQRAHAHDVRLPVKPLTGEPVSRTEMMKSKYYQYMDGAVQSEEKDCL